MTRSTERGAVLVTVLLIALAMTALAHAMLLLSRGELRASQAGYDLLRRRAGAEAAVVMAMATAVGEWQDTLPVHGEYVAVDSQITSLPIRGSYRRLSAEAWLIEGVSGPPSGPVARAGRLAWILDPVTRVSAFSAVVQVGLGAGIRLLGTVDTTQPLGVSPPLDPDDCLPWAAALSRTVTTSSLAPVITMDTVRPALGLLDFDSLFARVEVAVSGTGTPQATERLGQCLVSDPWNWGDPASGNACERHLALRGSPGDLTVDGGIGQGVLIVDGDMTFQNGARYYGLVVTSGVLRVLEATEIEGLFISEGGLEVEASASVRGSACWSAMALSAARANLGLPVLVPGGGSIGPF